MPRPTIYSPRRFAKLVNWILTHGTRVNPRGVETVEVMDAHLILRDPRDRLVFDPARKMNLAFAIADWVQIMHGDDTLEFLTDFVPKMKDFADPDDPTKVGGAYGPRLHDANQIVGIIAKLEKDPDSRQAVVTIYDGKKDLYRPGHVVPCTISLQFLIRGNKLHCIANMRSNDVVWGLTYDVFNFTMIQEYVAAALELDVGEYRHHAGSLHLYVKRDNELAKKLNPAGRYNLRMSPMPGTPNIKLLYSLIKEAKDLASRHFWISLEDTVMQYERDLALVTRYWFARNLAPYEAEAAYQATQEPAFRRLMKQWPIVK